MRCNHLGSVIFVLGIGLLLQACSLFGTDASGDILSDQIGTLSWGGSPAADGAGILFKTEKETYGAPGSKENYSDYFPQNNSKVQVKADIRLTGKKNSPGWGTEYPAITFIDIERVE